MSGADKASSSTAAAAARVSGSMARNSSKGGIFFTNTGNARAATVKSTSAKNKSSETSAKNGQRTIMLPLAGGTQAVCVVCPSESGSGDEDSFGTGNATVAENQEDKTTRKASHTEVERRRRQRIRFFIEKLASICMPGVTGGDITTGNVLERTYDHLLHVHSELNAVKAEHDRDVKMQQEYQMTLDIALKDLSKLRSTLTEHGISLPPLRLRVVDVPSSNSTATVAEGNGSVSSSSAKKRSRAAKRPKIEAEATRAREPEAGAEEDGREDESASVTIDVPDMYGGVDVEGMENGDEDAEEAEEN